MRQRHSLSTATCYKWKAMFTGREALEPKRLKALVQKHRQFGYRRLNMLIRLVGHEVNRNLVQRPHHEDKRTLFTRRSIVTPMRSNDRWNLDFPSDQLTNEGRFRMPAVIDDCTRKRQGLIASTSLSGKHSTLELDALSVERGKPITTIRNNGTEFTSNAIHGLTEQASTGNTSHLVSRCRTASWKA